MEPTDHSTEVPLTSKIRIGEVSDSVRVVMVTAPPENRTNDSTIFAGALDVASTRMRSAIPAVSHRAPPPPMNPATVARRRLEPSYARSTMSEWVLIAEGVCWA